MAVWQPRQPAEIGQALALSLGCMVAFAVMAARMHVWMISLCGAATATGPC